MYDLSELYYPITANPAGASEILPCRALRPYIRCFWGSAALQQAGAFEPGTPLVGQVSLTQEPAGIIPDTCMDILWEWDAPAGEAGGLFFCINDAPFYTGTGGQPTGQRLFGICF
ncbi:hypothetical protein AMQ83_06265, partial [Paenibacillus riograndensis]